jgi:hypothetical protein
VTGAERIERIRRQVAPFREALLNHRLYQSVSELGQLRLFMQAHVFAVWDFMSLLKTLQRDLCGVSTPWVPPQNRVATRLINEIVLGEESDEDPAGNYISHFDLYRRAMVEAGADTGPIDQLVAAIRRKEALELALGEFELPTHVRQFVETTFSLINSHDSSVVASAFTFGREDLLPAVFQRMVNQLNRQADGRLQTFVYYLDRHIEVDGDHHGPLSEKLVCSLCGDDPRRWDAAERAAVRALEARLALWDGIAEQLDSVPVLKAAGWELNAVR